MDDLCDRTQNCLCLSLDKQSYIHKLNSWAVQYFLVLFLYQTKCLVIVLKVQYRIDTIYSTEMCTNPREDLLYLNQIYRLYRAINL